MQPIHSFAKHDGSNWKNSEISYSTALLQDLLSKNDDYFISNEKKIIKQLGGLQNIIKALLLYTEMCDNNHDDNDNHNRNDHDKLRADSVRLQPRTDTALNDTSMKRSRSTHLQTIRNNINHSDSKSSASCQSTTGNINPPNITTTYNT